MPTKDLICDDQHFEGDVRIASLNDPHPPCPYPVRGAPDGEVLEVCGKPRRRSYLGPGNVPAIHLFRRHYHEGFGWVENADDWNLLRKRLAKAQGCSPEDFVQHQDSKTEMQTTADEARHRSYLRQKNKGLDPQQVREIKDTARRTGTNPLTGKTAKMPIKQAKAKAKPERKWRKPKENAS